jgi:hypothetical protein
MILNYLKLNTMGLFNKRIYTFIEKCYNCHKTVQIEIPKGIRKIDFMDSAKCPICECRMAYNYARLMDKGNLD